MQTDGQGAFPSEALLAKETGLSERAVGKHLKIAAETGWISRKLFRDKGRDWAGYRYCATLPKGIGAPEPRSAPNQHAPERHADGAEPGSNMVRNDVPTNTTCNSTYNSTENRLEEVFKSKPEAGLHQQEFHKMVESLRRR